MPPSSQAGVAPDQLQPRLTQPDALAKALFRGGSVQQEFSPAREARWNASLAYVDAVWDGGSCTVKVTHYPEPDERFQLA
jgi:hypothetical protein